MANETSPEKLMEDFVTAAWQNDIPVLNALAAKHPFLVDPSASYLQEALCAACGSGQFGAAKLLVEEYQANVNGASLSGVAPLHEAFHAKDLDIVRMLIENGANVDTRDASRNGFTDGWTPLHHAVQQASVDMVQYLLNRGANADLKNCAGQTPADMGRTSKNKNCVACADLIDRVTGRDQIPLRLRRRQPPRP